MRISGTVCAPVPLLGLGRPFRRAKLPLERTVHAGSEVRPAGPSSGLIAQIKGGPLPTNLYEEVCDRLNALERPGVPWVLQIYEDAAGTGTK